MTLKEAIYNRTSVRTFTGEIIPADLIRRLEEYIAHVPTPWNKPMGRIAMLRPDDDCDPSRFSTYGVIRGASHYMVLILDSRTDATRAALTGGYAMEHAVLQATSLGIATCWLGGTFRRAEIAPRVGLKDYETIVAIVAMGLAAPRRRLLENVMRSTVSAASRKPHDKLFFCGAYGSSCPADGPLFSAFEAVRKAPSACNRQPWRLLMTHDNIVRFYAAPDKGFQLNDMGIAMAHFDIARGFKAAWQTDDPAKASDNVPPTLRYVATAR